jgi:hypothetical protein
VSVTADIRAVFRASGRLGQDLLAVDWGSTPLGPTHHWPQSLKTVVGILLSSRFSMWMAWGPDLTFLCNDAYRRDTLGKKYPWALGRPAREVWAEIWPDIGPRIETVLRTGTATWDEALLLFSERSGCVEETYHTFSYSPLTDDGGRVVGMLCVVSEDTHGVISQRRMTTLRDLASEPSTIRTEAEVFEVLVRQLQLSAEELAGDGLETALASRVRPEDVGRVRAAMAAAARGEPLDYEVQVVTPDREVRTYRTLGQLVRDADGCPVRLRGSNQDVTEQRRAERALAAAAATQEASPREHQIADELQRSLLPARTFDPDHLDVATYYRAGVEGTHVGGDWYDVIELGAGRTALVLGDVMGRGVRAAVVMASCVPRCGRTPGWTSRRSTCWSSSTGWCATWVRTRS